MELLNREKAAALILDLGARAKSVQEDIHQILCSGLAHARDHGDYRTITMLLNALPNGQRVQAMAVWVSHFSSKKLSVTYDRKAGEWKGSLAKTRAPEHFLVDEACEVTFADFTKERVPRTLTVEQVLRYLSRQANNTDTVDGKPVVDPSARALCSRLHGIASGTLVAVTGTVADAA